SKAIDYADGNNRLAKIAKTLARAEEVAAELALHVLHDGNPPLAEVKAIEVVYPTEFDLFTAGEVARAAGEFQSVLGRAGLLPRTEGLLLGRLLRLCLPGMADGQYDSCDAEIQEYLEKRSGG
ncbi:MAG: hypothetical protein AB7I30_20560, partial [Isosphaeraceae bacterium]